MVNNYPQPVSQLLKLGCPEDPWLDYSSLGLTSDDIPELLRLLGDYDLRFSPIPEDLAEDEELPEWFAQIHAWRALAQLKAVQAIPAILGLLAQIDTQDDEWLEFDADDAFALIGPAAVEPLGAYLLDNSNLVYARGAVSASLQKLALEYPDTRSACLNYIVSALENYKEQDEGLNAFLIVVLVELKATEHIALIEQAFGDGCVDEIVMGGFEDVQVALGLLEERARPRYTSHSYPRVEGEQLVPAFKKPKSEEKEKKKRKQEKKSRKKNRKKK